MHKITNSAAVLAMAFFLVAAPSFAGADQSAKQDLKDAGHETKKAAVHTGKAVKKGSKKVVHKTADVTAKGAEKLKEKTQQ